ncbi:LacI family DNA-binding transcriptional regulator [uncultured Amnibacterium sp.]|uniref:LacI family DNA-binding transcriptional regulator n=1 Tax=uncultured Amnibacterium sp. TaxID=1631851 RepID=UPI0035CC0D72
MDPSPVKPARAPSIRDVARAAGVSHQTVSRVLNKSESIRDETREKVLAVMAELSYHPNRAARTLVTSRSKTLGVLSSIRGHYGPARSIQAIEQAARERGYYVTTASVASPGRPAITDALAHLMSQDIEGLVVIAPQQRVFEVIADLQLDVPHVTLRSMPGSQNALSVDEISGARLATRHLLDLGHRHIRHLAGPRDWIEAEARMQGFLLEVSDRDLPLLAPVLGDWTADFGYRAGRELLRWRDATAFFTANDQMALGLMHAALEMGLRVPEDLSIVGFDDMPEAAHFAPPLTTVRQDFASLGRRCVARLLDGASDPVHDALDAETEPAVDLIVRASTAPPRRSIGPARR